LEKEQRSPMRKLGKMIRLSLNLPKKYRLNLHLVKRRGASVDSPVLPSLESIKHTKKGSKISRYFRHIFEHKSIKRIFGTNIALLVVATTFLPQQSNLADSQADPTVITTQTQVLTTQKGIQYPLENIKITQGFKFYHPGIDLDGVTGDIVRPIMAGVVEAIDFSKIGYGNAILINHGNGITSLYAHLSKILVRKDQEVNTNTIIGLVGATGHAYGDHLHLETRQNGVAFNPLSILPN
jgi:murein DD-endopeptidase MepM/ murein hydrolase activator NlpD